ncbi:prolyl 4-hydroxylase subunit alpha-2-like [Hyposmocoma kahamanoa]|uniref:prolyl 4-hydroxylase subunit alpha-2-like n=1 Tax=Hyposmocoma kahamanoa TaxID=1477025 RepID=UPI000E6D8C19|nr:prolyl 4-hydroxylase subunit alpha-2-like [Hyposmocoma kahamanoa]
MTAIDCYNLALMLYKYESTYYNYKSYAAEWFEVALEKLNEQDENPFTATEIMMYIVKSYYYSPIPLASKVYAWVENLYTSKPNETNSVLQLYKTAIRRPKSDETFNQYTDLESEYYAALCRSESDVPATNTKKLKCSYLKSNPFLKLAPIKMEELNKNPNVFLFYDVISDNEIETIKTLASPELKCAQVYNGKCADFRTGKNAWLSEDEDVVAKVRRRAADFTGLSLTHAEELQVLNYGIGGHYDWHYDAFEVIIIQVERSNTNY